MKTLYVIVYLFLFVAISLLGTASVHAMEKQAEATGQLINPTLEYQKDDRIGKLKAYLASNESPLTQEANHFVSEADRLEMDWKLVAAISGVESTFGKHVPAGSYNAWGWGIPTGASWGLAFPDWKAGITAVSDGLRTNYIDRGAKTIDQIGYIYAASPTWASRVRYFIDQIETYKPTDPEQIEVTL